MNSVLLFSVLVAGVASLVAFLAIEGSRGTCVLSSQCCGGGQDCNWPPNNDNDDGHLLWCCQSVGASGRVLPAWALALLPALFDPCPSATQCTPCEEASASCLPPRVRGTAQLLSQRTNATAARAADVAAAMAAASFSATSPLAQFGVCSLLPACNAGLRRCSLTNRKSWEYRDCCVSSNKCNRCEPCDDYVQPTPPPGVAYKQALGCLPGTSITEYLDVFEGGHWTHYEQTTYCRDDHRPQEPGPTSPPPGSGPKPPGGSGPVPDPPEPKESTCIAPKICCNKPDEPDKPKICTDKPGNTKRVSYCRQYDPSKPCPAECPDEGDGQKCGTVVPQVVPCSDEELCCPTVDRSGTTPDCYEGDDPKSGRAPVERPCCKKTIPEQTCDCDRECGKAVCKAPHPGNRPLPCGTCEYDPVTGLPPAQPIKCCPGSNPAADCQQSECAGLRCGDCTGLKPCGWCKDPSKCATTRCCKGAPGACTALCNSRSCDSCGGAWNERADTCCRKCSTGGATCCDGRRGAGSPWGAEECKRACGASAIGGCINSCPGNSFEN